MSQIECGGGWIANLSRLPKVNIQYALKWHLHERFQMLLLTVTPLNGSKCASAEIIKLDNVSLNESCYIIKCCSNFGCKSLQIMPCYRTPLEVDQLDMFNFERVYKDMSKLVQTNNALHFCSGLPSSLLFQPSILFWLTENNVR